MKKKLLILGGVIVVVALLCFGVFVQMQKTSSLSQGYATDEMRAGVSRGWEEEAMDDRALDMPKTASAVPSPTNQAADFDRIVVYSASISIVANDVSATVETIKAHTTEVGGYVASVSSSLEQDVPRAQMSLRIPTEKLEDTLQFIREQGVRVVDDSLSGQDVTEEYVDLQARLKNLQASETQLLTIMKTASKVEDVLKVHSQLQQVREEIERLQGRKQYLDHWTKLADVRVSLSTDASAIPVVKSSETWRPLVIAKEAIAALVLVLKSVVNVIIWIVVFIPIWGTAILAVLWKRRKKKTPSGRRN